MDTPKVSDIVRIKCFQSGYLIPNFDFLFSCPFRKVKSVRGCVKITRMTSTTPNSIQGLSFQVNLNRPTKEKSELAFSCDFVMFDI